MRALSGALLLAAAMCGLPSVTSAQEVAPSAWRVECSGDGKTLNCTALQQLFLKETRQLVAQVSVSLAQRAPQMTILLPLGVNVSEPVEVQVDNGEVRRFRIDTCANSGCFVTLAPDDRFVSELRAGSQFKIALHDTAKRPVRIEIPLLGFGLALDKLLQ
ncbi:invasion associated locus B family protein [Reyranella sp.]|uniref:invasion associated locus B family protein n=1 Tax=Reyranella sp. TaxID=1929291 RepID=UPI002F959E15